MATFVLVPGFWLGAWAWSGVTRRLRAAGHDVYPVTLTGLGDRVHLATPETDLETHAADVLNVIEYAGLGEVILVGHSGGGLPVTLAADRAPGRIARAVYLDSAPLPDGMAQIDVHSPEERERIEKQVAGEGGGLRIPVPAFAAVSDDPVNLAGLSDDDLALMRARGVPQPFGAARQPLRRSGRGAVPETLIVCTFAEEGVRAMIAERHPMYAGFGDGIDVVALPTGHYPMFSRPDDTARVLASLA